MSNKAKKKYFGGVIDSADETQLLRKEARRNQESLTSHPEGGDNVVQTDNGSLGFVYSVYTLQLFSLASTNVTAFRQRKINDVGDSSGGECPTTSTDLRETHIDGKKHSHTRRAVNGRTGQMWFQYYSEFLFHCR